MSIERSTRILLGINAALTACLLWVNIAGIGPLSNSADAAPQYRSTRSSQASQQAENSGVAGASTRQRKEMITQLTTISKSVKTMQSAFASGNVNVKVGNLDEITLDIDYDRLARALERASK
jgi:hypothetical protein